MSALNPEEWKATEDEIADAHLHRTMYLDGREAEARKPFEAVARRRALAELRALAVRSCAFCAKADSPAVLCYGVWIHSYGGPHVDCKCPRINDRIAEIEAEAE